MPPVPTSMVDAGHKCHSYCPEGCRTDNVEEMWLYAYPAALRIVEAELRSLASAQFAASRYSAGDPRAAAIWDCAAHVGEKMMERALPVDSTTP
jgi:hypothetical protein